MVLIVDSGSTKSDWAILRNGKVVLQRELEGINPFFHTEEQMGQAFRQVPGNGVRHIHYYGAGCSEGVNRAKIHRALKRAFPSAQMVEVDSDLMGAARGLCRNEAGIAGILGTGSNCCVYKEGEITEQWGGLGYILGDEGSGAVLGRMLLQDFLNQKLPLPLQEELRQGHKLSRELILQKVYREPLPNRFLASWAPVAHQYRQEPHIRRLLARHFGAFFEQMSSAFSKYAGLPVHLTGSIAWYFKEEVLEAGKDSPFAIGTVIRSPMPGLIRCHRGH